MVLEIYYWSIRGLVENIVTLCEYIGIDYKLNKIKTRDEWLGLKNEYTTVNNQYFINLPHIKDDDVIVNETDAIMHYICTKYSKDLLPSLPEDYKLMELSGVLKDLKINITRMFYTSKDLSELTTNYKNNFDYYFLNKFKGVDNILKENKYLVNNKLSYWDFYFAEFIEMVRDFETENNLSLSTNFQNIKNHLSLITNLEKVKEYRSSNKHASRPYNNYQAVWK